MTTLFRSVMLAVFAAALFAQQDYDNAGAIESQPAATASKYAASAGNAAFGTSFLTTTVELDREYCATGGIQCSGTGLTPGVAAGKTNRNPVRIGLQVLDSGAPVTTLTDADITVINPFVPAGGASAGKLSCGSCFQNGGNGLYAIFVNPAVSGFNWKPGAYFVQILVTTGASTSRTLVKVDIPF